MVIVDYDVFWPTEQYANLSDAERMGGKSAAAPSKRLSPVLRIRRETGIEQSQRIQHVV